MRARGARIGKWLTLEEADYLLVFSLSGASRLKGVHVRDPRHHWWPADCAGGEAAGVCLENEMHMGPVGFSKRLDKLGSTEFREGQMNNEGRSESLRE